MYDGCSSVALSELGVLRVRGADALAFLQGQLSNDMQLLNGARSVLAGYHNPQGRVIALLRLAQLSPGDVVAVLPHELLAGVTARLTKFILRSKVRLADDSAQWQLNAVIGVPRTARAALPEGTEGAAVIDGTLALRLPGAPPRWLLLRPAGAAPLIPDCTPAPRVLWQRLAIAAGEPQVYAATTEEFVAQMLNLDALGGIAFDKGCYTGQEVIARAHYRGRVKRRLQRFVSATPRLLQPGEAGELEDGRHFKVVDAVALEDGRCEFLAVTALEGATAEAGAAAAPAAIKAQPLPLPYALPE
jgi:tRNA-modifying protein YgfZ